MKTHSAIDCLNSAKMSGCEQAKLLLFLFSKQHPFEHRSNPIDHTHWLLISGYIRNYIALFILYLDTNVFIL